MKLKSPKRKGSYLEYMWRDKIRESGLDKFAQRTPMSGALAMIPSDIVTKLPFAFECKFYKRHSIYKFWDQAKRSSSAVKDPAIVLKANDRPILITIDGDTFLSLLTYALASGYPNKSLENNT